MPKKICNFADCHKIIPGNEKYCEEHKKLYEELKTDNNRRYDIKIRNQRDKKYTEFYHSKSWFIIRQQVMERDNGLCLLCLANKKINSADAVHHIEELKVNYNKGNNKDNLICLCSSCHNMVHAEYDKGNKVEMQKHLRSLIR